MAWHKSNEAGKRPATAHGIGPLAVSALVTSVDASSFKNGRSFAALICPMPKQSSSGGNERLGKIAKRGDHYLRWLVVVGCLAVIPLCPATRHTSPLVPQAIAAAHDEDRRSCSDQQDGADRLGADVTRRRLTRTRDMGRIGNEQPYIGRGSRGWRGLKASHAASGRSRRSSKPIHPMALRARAFEKELI